MPTRLYKSGFGTTDTPGDIVCLRADLSTSGSYFTFNNGGVVYQVPTLSSLYITHLIYSVATTTGDFFRLLYGTNAIQNTTTAVAGEVVRTSYFTGDSAAKITAIDIFVPIPGANYPAVFRTGSGGNMQITAFGIVV